MGLNSRFSDAHSDLACRVTESREARDAEIRQRVRNGEISLETYITDYKGFKRERLPRLLPQFRTAIFG
jgi:hypothetical protein